MSYKEKYEKAIVHLKKFLAGDCVIDQDILADFPELRESEDERIRKNLISFLEALYAKGKSAYDGEQWSKSDCADWIAYLEKQKEQKPTSFNEPFNPDEYEVVMEGNATSLKRKEQNPAWSEEDEETIEILKKILKVNHPNGKFKITEAGTIDIKYISTDEVISRLESLRPQPKPSWSQEDEKILHAIEFHIGQLDSGETINGFSSSDMLRFFKSIRPQPHWKPSEEQMKALERYVKGNQPIQTNTARILSSLLDDLLKLK